MGASKQCPIIVEPEAESTAQSTAAAAEIMRRMGLASCILVSDGYHIFRARRMLADARVESIRLPAALSRRGRTHGSGGCTCASRSATCCGGQGSGCRTWPAAPYSFSSARRRLVCTRLTGISVCFLSSMRSW